ncbi:MAG: amino acid adenylation domain-containing protein [Symploca sp. SIO2D2]|nr:amino acid adenylation domain-containing protein [Symploca sp. SIO2D2]
MKSKYLNTSPASSSLVDILLQRAQNQPDKKAYIFLQNGETESGSLTYGELDRQARAIAADLQQWQGERALLLHPSGLEFITAFFGCLYAGVVAVPVYPPRRNQKLSRLLSIVNDAQAKLALTTTSILADVEKKWEEEAELAKLKLVATDTIEANEGDFVPQSLTPESLAFLQYTSGSTGTPKGVMVSHGNILHNQQLIHQAFGHSEQTISAGWLPLFHDMGLIWQLMHPMYLGTPCILMPPVAFLMKPIRWLKAISKYGATTSGGPNFAYDLCIKKIPPEQLADLDLSSWDLAFNGAEPVRAETLKQFADKFAQSGFLSSAFYPCYGMAETTLFATGGDKNNLPEIQGVLAGELEQNSVVESEIASPESRVLVGCGRPYMDMTVIIVNPDSLTRCSNRQVGEIWVSGGSIASGYWNRPEATEETFQAYVADTGEGPFLRTGDLGFKLEGEVFVTGRLKDMIIIRGRNHYPQDIELTVENSHRALRSHCSAAFSLEIEGEERLVVACEVERTYLRKLNPSEVVKEIQIALSTEHELEVYGVVLLKTGSIPKTSSGKIQRRACRLAFETGKLQVITQSFSNVNSEDLLEDVFESILNQELPTTDLASRLLLALKTWIGSRIGLELKEIDVQQGLTSLGLDSLGVTQFAAWLEDRLGIHFSVSELFDATTLHELALDLARRLTEKRQLKGESQFLDLPTIIPDTEHFSQPFPLTDIQQAYWLGRGNSFELGNVTTHIYLEFQCQDLNIPRLTQAWRELVNRHEMLRAIVLPTGEQQILNSVDSYCIKVNRLFDSNNSQVNAQEIDSRLEGVRSVIRSRVRPSEQWPLFEIQVSDLSQGQWRLHLYFDLLIADSRSLMHLLEEWDELYQASPTDSSNLSLTFRDYVMAERQLERTRIYQQSRNYWLERLDTLPPAPDLPLKSTKGDLSQPQFTTHRAQLSSKSWKVLKQRAGSFGITPSGLLMAAFAEVLSLWSRRSYFSLNLTLDNRLPLHPQVEQIIGDFTSLIPLEVNYTDINVSFCERAMQLQTQLWKDLEHRYFSGIRVQRELASRRGGRIATLPIVFTSLLGLPQFQKRADAFTSFGKLVYNINPTAQVWLNHQVWEQSEQLVYSWDVLEDMFPPNLIEDMFCSYGQLLELLACSEAPWQAVRPQEIPLSHQSLWENYNLPRNGIETPSRSIQKHSPAPINITKPDLEDEMLHTLFVKSVNKHPDKCAVISPHHTLTYSDLFLRAQQVSNQLKRLGAYPNKLIAVVMTKGWEQVVAVLGILLSGAAYVPIDPELPQKRLYSLLDRAQVNLVLTQKDLADRITWPENINCLSVASSDLSEIAFSEGVTFSLEPIQKPDDLAYVIYTSGSTGTPKGVMIDHRGAVNTILGINDRFNVISSDRVLALSSLNFDLSVYDIFGILAAGGTVVFPDSSELKNPRHWLDLLSQHQITIWNSVPMLMQMLTEYLSGGELSCPEDLRIVMLSGDYIPLKLPKQIQEFFSQAEVISLGGATEASIWSIFYPIQTVDSNWKTIPYGHPLPQQTIYVLDEYLELCPIWVPGQIYIGGVGVAQGYWHDEVRTQSSFFAHPRTGERLYRTGDWGCLWPEGEVEFLGREDFQVKVNGYRIELGEIEGAINQYPQIQGSVVQVWRENLVAYLVPHDHHAISIPDVEAFLRARLPDYMVPNHFTCLKCFPLTTNGKIDRKSLPEPIRLPLSPISVTSPKTDLEQRLAILAQEVFEIPSIGRQQNFFDAGASSLHLVRLNNRIKAEFDQEISLMELFKNPTISFLASFLQQGENEKSESVQRRDFQKIIEKRQEFLQKRRKLHNYLEG